MDCCSRCYRCFSESTLQVFNLVDFCAAIILLTYGIYVRVTLGKEFDDPAAQWLGVSFLILGVALALMTMMSFCAITSKSCVCLMTPSSWLAVLVAMFILSLAVSCVIMKHKIFNFVTDHQDSIGLSDQELQDFKNWYEVSTYILFGLFFVELVRFNLSRGYRQSVRAETIEYQRLLDQEEDANKRRELETKLRLKSKYDGLKSHYREKYNINRDESLV